MPNNIFDEIEFIRNENSKNKISFSYVLINRTNTGNFRNTSIHKAKSYGPNTWLQQWQSNSTEKSKPFWAPSLHEELRKPIYLLPIKMATTENSSKGVWLICIPLKKINISNQKYRSFHHMCKISLKLLEEFWNLFFFWSMSLTN